MLSEKVVTSFGEWLREREQEGRLSHHGQEGGGSTEAAPGGGGGPPQRTALPPASTCGEVSIVFLFPPTSGWLDDTSPLRGNEVRGSISPPSGKHERNWSSLSRHAVRFP